MTESLSLEESLEAAHRDVAVSLLRRILFYIVPFQRAQDGRGWNGVTAHQVLG
jgi:hypothetical protein